MTPVRLGLGLALGACMARPAPAVRPVARRAPESPFLAHLDAWCADWITPRRPGASSCYAPR
jgi:hypothetical protein